MQKILFLDVDGPLIPSGMYLVHKNASYERKCSPICVAIVNELCRKADAKIVLNSTHSREANIAIEDLKREGLERFHDIATTNYPNKMSGGDRMAAIEDWQERCGGVDWIAFDDSNFTENERLVLIDFDVGITLKHYNKAAEMWGLKPIIIF